MLADSLNRTVLVLDGAMGTLLRRHAADERACRGERFARFPIDLAGNCDVLTLTQPQVVSGIHDAYLAAGADIIETNTFCGTRIMQARYGLGGLAYELNHTAARLARAVAREWSSRTPARPRFVAGAIGPVVLPHRGKTVRRPPGTVELDGVYDAYREQAGALIDGGADLLLIETIVDERVAAAAVDAAADALAARRMELPVALSAVVDSSGRLPSGGRFDAFLASIARVRLLAAGLNCMRADDDLRAAIGRLAGSGRSAVLCYPNAGIPDGAGAYATQPGEMAGRLRDMAESGTVKIVGGCCGTTPAYVEAIARAVRPAGV